MNVGPRKRLVETSDLTLSDAPEYVSEPSLRVDGVELGHLDKAVELKSRGRPVRLNTGPVATKRNAALPSSWNAA